MRLLFLFISSLLIVFNAPAAGSGQLDQSGIAQVDTLKAKDSSVLINQPTIADPKKDSKIFLFKQVVPRV